MAKEKKGLLSEVEFLESVREKRTKPSFMASLVDGRPDWQLIYPYPFQSPEHKAIGDAFIQKIEPFVRGIDSDAIERGGEIPKELLEGLAELGCFAMNIPKEYGGLGFSEVNYNRVLQFIASKNEVIALTLSAHQSIGLPHPLKHSGTEEQRRTYLPDMARGSVSAFALTEKEAGSDPSRMELRAEFSEDGREVILNGEKWYCTNGTIADTILVMAKVPRYSAKDIGAFIVPMNTPGITRTKCEFMGFRGLSNARIKLENVRIPVENAIGEERKGLRLALTALNDGRISVSALVLGGAKRTWEPLLWWAKERVQFGQALASYEANAVSIARVAADLFAMDAMTWLVAGLADLNKVDLRIEAATTKLFCSERYYRDVIETLMELRGGRGYETAESLRRTEEPAPPVEQWFRNARIYIIGEGASNTLHLSLIRDLFESFIEMADVLEKSEGTGKAYAFLRTAMRMAGWRAKQSLARNQSSAPASLLEGFLGYRVRYVDETSRRFAKTLFSILRGYQKELKDRQILTFRLVDICADLFAISSACSYAQSLDDRKDERAREAVQIADYFCGEAATRIENSFRTIESVSDIKGVWLAKTLLKDGASWISEGTLKQEYESMQQ